MVLVACARGLNERAPPTDQLLSATGFQMRYADTPGKRAELERMAQRRLVPARKAVSCRMRGTKGYAALVIGPMPGQGQGYEPHSRG